MTEVHRRVLCQAYDDRSIWVTVTASSQAQADERALDWLRDPRNRLEIKWQSEKSFGPWRVCDWFRCFGCGRETSPVDGYGIKVQDEIWRQIGRGDDSSGDDSDARHRPLCRECAEKRLGRPLGPDDLGKPADLLLLPPLTRVGPARWETEDE